MASRPINLKQLSEHLGLSQTTVSRALNGFPEVNEKTRARVCKLAAEMNYRPSPSAMSLATGRTNVIGHVLPLSEHRMINPHFADFLAGASETYSACGYDLLLRMAAPGEEEEIYRDFVSRRRVDGVVVHGPLNNEPRIKLLKSIGLPFVVHGRSDAVPDTYSWLDVNNTSAIQTATDLLLNNGHTKIALVNGLETMNFAMRRRAGYMAAMKKRGIAPNEKFITSEDMTEPYGYRATRHLLDLNGSPTAFVYSSILSALGGLRALNELGLQPAKDISMVTFDDQLSFLQAGRDATDQSFFTAMRSSISAAGRRLAEILIEQIQQPGNPPVQELWEAEFVAGHTA